MGEEVNVNVVFPDNMTIETSLTKTTKDFIIDLALRLYSSMNFDMINMSPDKFARLCIKRADIMANELIKAGLLNT